ncbi:MAG TPA: hypothetical protein VKN36_00425 [Eudoraea sp.]|nr:hypothetical protein [Eudoraea sp.]
MDIEMPDVGIVLLQIQSGFYLGLATLNWMTKRALIGGVYNRPLAMGNLFHFGIGAIALVKSSIKTPDHYEIIIPLTLLYSTFTAMFLFVIISNPAKTYNV